MTGGVIGIGGGSTSGPVFTIGVGFVAATGTQSMGPGSAANATLTDGSGRGWTASPVAAGSSGTVTVTSVSATGARGTFSMTMVPLSGGATGNKVVTNGAFDVTF
jgi:hypothetical protein